MLGPHKHQYINAAYRRRNLPFLLLQLVRYSSRPLYLERRRSMQRRIQSTAQISYVMTNMCVVRLLVVRNVHRRRLVSMPSNRPLCTCAWLSGTQR
jgi:hypothetical protein